MIRHIRSKRMIEWRQCTKKDEEKNDTNLETENWMEENRMNKS
jgi:hypothetical protein